MSEVDYFITVEPEIVHSIQVQAPSAPSVIQVGQQGPPGPPGPEGPAGASYVHTQNSAATSWTVNHNLGFFPSVTCLNSGSVEIEGSVIHNSINQCTITFDVAVSGQCRCI